MTAPFSRATRDVPRRPELPEPDTKPLPQDVPGVPGTEWVADDRSDVGARIEEGVSEADAAKRRGKINDAQRQGISALAQLAARQHAQREAALVRAQLAAAQDGIDPVFRRSTLPFVPYTGDPR